MSTIPFKISAVSIPVVPKTPGEIALTGLVFLSKYCGTYFNRCLVISISFITFGPNASGVTYIFPKPTTNISCSLLTYSSIIFFNSSHNISLAF